MFQKNASNSLASNQNQTSTGLRLVGRSADQGESRPNQPSSVLDLVVIAGRRCSSFFAEAAVLVLVFGILDFFMLKGRIELAWIVGALAISIVLLAASITMDFAAHRWIKAHP
jgi:hypothetical protein